MGEPKIQHSAYDNVSQRVNHLRFINRLSQKQLALRLGLKPATFSQKINGGTRWNLEEIIELTDTFGVSFDYLIGREPIESAMPHNEKTPSEEGVSVVTPVAEAGLDPATSRL